MSIRTGNCLVALLALVLLMSFTTSPGDATAQGRTLYEAHCVRCHGADGAKRKWGAKDLRTSRLSDDRILERLRSGAGIMPSFTGELSEGQMRSVVQYVKALRTS